MTQPLPVAPEGLLDTEPVAALLTGLAGVVDLGIVLANAFDWVALTDTQTAAVVAFISGATAVVGAALRSRVWSPASVRGLVQPVAPESDPL